MSSIPNLPDIKPKHRLNVQKATNRILENINACRDTGLTSDAIKIREINSIDKVATHRKIKSLTANSASLENFLKINNKNSASIQPKPLILKSIDEWRKKEYPYDDRFILLG